MAAITFGGIGSGIDVEGIISGLVSASQDPIDRAKARRSGVNTGIAALSDIGTMLAKLKTSLGDLDTAAELGSFSATSSDKAVVATAQGNALPGSYKISVSQLASAERRYSDPIGSSSSAALGKTGSLSIRVGTGDPESIAIVAGDTMDTIIGKINDADGRFSASAFFDGEQYRIQVRGLDTGEDNYLTFDESGLSSGLGFNTVGNKADEAQNAMLKVDDFDVESTTNKITGAIPGVTLALTDDTAGEEITVNVEGDQQGMTKKLQDMVDAYNTVITKLHTTAGYGKIKALTSELAGDSTLRAVESRMSSLLTNNYGSGKYQTMRSIGLQRNNDGTLKIDAAALKSALEADPEAVTKVLAGDSSQGGVIDSLLTAVTNITESNGILQAKKDGLDARAKALGERVDVEQSRLSRYAEALRKQFTQMDTSVARSQAQIQYLQSFRF